MMLESQNVSFKKPRPIASDFSNFMRFWYQKNAHIFLITPGEFYSWKMYHLEDINENVTIVMVTIIKLIQYSKVY